MLVGFRVWGKTARYQKSAIKTWLKINVHSYQKITRHFNGFHNICPTKNSWLIKRTEKWWKISLLKTSISKKTAPENSRIKSPGDAIARNQGNTSTNHQGLGCHPQGATWPSWLAKKVDLKSLGSKTPRSLDQKFCREKTYLWYWMDIDSDMNHMNLNFVVIFRLHAFIRFIGGTSASKSSNRKKSTKTCGFTPWRTPEQIWIQVISSTHQGHPRSLQIGNHRVSQVFWRIFWKDLTCAKRFQKCYSTKKPTLFKQKSAPQKN